MVERVQVRSSTPTLLWDCRAPAQRASASARLGYPGCETLSLEPHDQLMRALDVARLPRRFPEAPDRVIARRLEYPALSFPGGRSLLADSTEACSVSTPW